MVLTAVVVMVVSAIVVITGWMAVLTVLMLLLVPSGVDFLSSHLVFLALVGGGLSTSSSVLIRSASYLLLF
jgi:hypothetical protein